MQVGWGHGDELGRKERMLNKCAEAVVFNVTESN